MCNFKTLLVMFCLTISGTLSYAHKTNKPEMREDGVSIEIKQKALSGQSDKSTSIQATINGHSLTVVFTENLGNVQVEVTDSTGGTVDYWDIWTPNGYIVYIYDTGSYVVTFTLPNGDEYYGEFEVTD